MRTLAIDCATEACSAALFERDSLVAGTFEVIGRGHAERLVPMIAELQDKGRAERIVVSLGPGSFTGVRIGLAAARALGIAWQAEVLGYPTLALVAATAQAERPGPVTVCMTGGHGEWFVQDFAPDGQPQAPLASLTPQQAAETAEAAAHDLVAGSQAEALVALRGHRTALALLPDARRFPLLPTALLDSALAPLYGRAPDAKLPGPLGDRRGDRRYRPHHGGHGSSLRSGLRRSLEPAAGERCIAHAEHPLPARGCERQRAR